MADLSKRIKELKTNVEENNNIISGLKKKNTDVNKTIKKLETIEKNINELFEPEVVETNEVE